MRPTTRCINYGRDCAPYSHRNARWLRAIHTPLPPLRFRGQTRPTGKRRIGHGSSEIKAVEGLSKRGRLSLRLLFAKKIIWNRSLFTIYVALLLEEELRYRSRYDRCYVFYKFFFCVENIDRCVSRKSSCTIIMSRVYMYEGGQEFMI